MPSKNIQRLKRGELSRISPQQAKHTDVHHPAPAAANKAPAAEDPSASLKEEVKQLKKELEDAKSAANVHQLTANKTADELAAVREELKEAKAEAAAAPEAPPPVEKIKITKIVKSAKRRGTIKLDCEVDPGDALAESISILVAAKELKKVLEMDEPGDEA